MSRASARLNGADEAVTKGLPLRVAEPAEGVAMLRKAQATVQEADMKALLESWEPCQPIFAPTVQPFPLEVFAPWARDYLQAVASSLGTPTDFGGMWFLGLLALLFQKRWKVEVKPDWQEILVLWVIVAAWSGTRKTPNFKKVFAPGVAFNDRFAKLYTAIRKKTEREQRALTVEIAHLKEKKAAATVIRQKEEELDKLTMPPIPKLFAGTITPERLETALRDQLGRFGLASAESDILAMMLGKYRSSGGPPPIENLLSAWSGDDIDSEYQGRGSVYIPEPHLSLALGTQPANLNDFYGTPKLGSRGTFGRFLPSNPECEISEDWDTPPIDQELERLYFDNVLKMAPTEGELAQAFEDGAFTTKTLRFGTAAVAEFRPYFREIQRRRKENGDLRFMEEWSAKLAGQVARIAALLHLSDHPEGGVPLEIGPGTIKRAILLSESYLVPMAKKVFGRASMLPKLQKLWEALLSFESAEVKRSQLGQGFGISGEDIEAGLAVLEEHHFLRVEKRRTGTRGPQSQVILLRPNPPRGVSGVSGVSANGLKPRPAVPSGNLGKFSGVSGSFPSGSPASPGSHPLADSPEVAAAQLELEEREERRALLDLREDIPL